jgi:hypothetical protein
LKGFALQGKAYGIENEAILGACFLPLGIGKAGAAFHSNLSHYLY